MKNATLYSRYNILTILHYNSIWFSMIGLGRSSKLGGCFRWFTLGRWWISPNSFHCRWSVCSLQHGGNEGDFSFLLLTKCIAVKKYFRLLILWFDCRRNLRRQRTKWKKILKPLKLNAQTSRPWWAIWRRNCTPNLVIPSTWKPKRNKGKKIQCFLLNNEEQYKKAKKSLILLTETNCLL